MESALAPLHALFIALALQPFRWAETLFDLSLEDDVVIGSMFLVSRGLSVVLVGLSLMLTFDVARMLADRRAGYFAAALLATSPVVVFFGSLSNLEIPHLFWVTLTFWAWLKLWQHRRVFWFAAFGTAVGLSIAAMDVALLSTTAKSFWWAAGSPLVIAFLIGIVVALRRRQWLTCGLLLPAITYSITFLAVILYVYDRFLIGWLPIASAIGGIGLSALYGIRYRARQLGAVVATLVPARSVFSGSRFESTPPLWTPLYWEPRFRNRVEDIETTSDKPLHAIEVWECRDREGCDHPVP